MKRLLFLLCCFQLLSMSVIAKDYDFVVATDGSDDFYNAPPVIATSGALRFYSNYN